MADFIRNCWYVAAWSTELGHDGPIARQIIGEPLALFRRTNGAVVAFEDRCPHRMAPLSAGRLEGDELRCMYHGLRFNFNGVCVAVPGTDRLPPRLSVRTWPVVERGGWIWVWMGDPQKATRELIPEAWGLDNPNWHLKEGVLDYQADYQLINDNLLDLSHLDYLHEKTLGAATGGRWSDEEPMVRTISGGVHVARWLRNTKSPHTTERFDVYTSYDFLLPGIFLQHVRTFPPGTAEHHADGLNLPTPGFERIDQQAVTPTASGRSRYLYAIGISARNGDKALAAQLHDEAQEAFMQDKTMIEAQARVLAGTDSRRRMAFIPQDKAPTLFRKLIAKRLAAETAPTAEAPTTTLI